MHSQNCSFPLVTKEVSLPSSFPILCILQSPPRCMIETKASGFPVHTSLGWWCCPHRGDRLLRDPWQNAGLQYAIFLKVNNETIAVRHLNRPWRPQGQEGSRRVPGAGMALLQRSTFLTGTHQWFSFPQLASSPNHSRRSREEMGSIPTPTRLSDACYRSSWPCLVDLHSQAPCSKHLSVPLQTVSVALASSCQEIFPVGALGNRLALTCSPPLASALKITQVATQRS